MNTNYIKPEIKVVEFHCESLLNESTSTAGAKGIGKYNAFENDPEWDD